MTWLHWIDKEYTILRFQKEAKRDGIARRVSLRVLRQMSWGDIVTCVQQRQVRKFGSMFMEFPIEIISGLSQDAQRAVIDEFEGVAVDLGCSIVHRRSGEYVTGITYSVTAAVSQIAAALENAEDQGVDIGEPMIGCYPGAIMPVFFDRRPYPVLADVPFFEGFRAYDREATLEAMAFFRLKHKPPRLKGQFEVEGPSPSAGFSEEGRPGDVQAILNYQKGGEVYAKTT